MATTPRTEESGSGYRCVSGNGGVAVAAATEERQSYGIRWQVGISGQHATKWNNGSKQWSTTDGGDCTATDEVDLVVVWCDDGNSNEAE
ncbi:hypothetical protein L1987_12988 [Smallanthus sonchifolius]|uniref:Uncharacterized protein n=1 Tax=Smallanthus sonchifolius TaxID=185202 RepID=A0ACB9JGV0_9ASTR|nr:hypothetical protein L1987_12988 [Smallanthus sonchifolius]